MTDLEHRLVRSLGESSELLSEWIVVTVLPQSVAAQGGQVASTLRTLAMTISSRPPENIPE